MYTKFFGLAEAPFNITPDSRFLFLSKRHKEALASLLYGIKHRKGFIAITGEIGSGKTTLCRALLNELDPHTTKVALILNSSLSELELLKTINEEFAIRSTFDSKKALIDELNRFLLLQNSQGNNAVIIIDEAQNLSPDCLEQIRMLGNLETETEKLLQIVLMGQPELGHTLSLPALEQLNQRIAVRYHISALNEEEIAHYIRHRLSVAQAKIDIEFTPQALQLIYESSRGIPRKINLVCDRAMLAAFVEATYTIDARLVRCAMAELAGGQPGALTREQHRPPVSLPHVLGKYVLVGGALILLGAAIGIGIWLANYNMRSIINEHNPAPSRSSRAGEREVVAAQVSGMVNSGEPLDDAGSEDTGNGEQLPAQPAQESTSAQGYAESAPESQGDFSPSHVSYYNWEYDEDNIVRVNGPEYAYPASILTWLGLWNMRVDLSDFKHYSADTLSQLALLTTNSPLGLRLIDLGSNLSEAIKYDVPLILHLEDSTGRFAPYVVLLRVEGESCKIADPVRGLLVTDRRRVGSCFQNALALYFDKEAISSIQPGEESERVQKLQNYLLRRQFYAGAASGVFDLQTAKAIKNFQRYYHLDPTGRLDEKTVLLLSSRMHAVRPRLFSSGGED
jgi:general secretion pathway protein A